MQTYVKSLLIVLIAFIDLWLSFLMLPQLAWAGTALGTLAAQMQGGEWRELTTNNMTPSLDNLSGANGVITIYTDDMVWDPAGEQAFVIGADHLASEGPQFVSYTASNNTWQRLVRPSWLSALTFFHGYDHSAINQADRIFYHRPYGKNEVNRYNISSQTWTTLPAPTFLNDYANCCDALEYFPELNGLVWVRGNPGEVWLFKEGTQQWSRLGSVQNGGTWQQAEYNPVHRVMVFIVGGLFYKLSNTGQVTSLATPPISFYDGSGYNGVLTVDPVSGDYLALTPTNRSLYRYNVLNDSWQAQSSLAKPDLSQMGVVATPVSTYGVTLFAACTRGNCRTYLYKHSPSVPDTQNPTVPTNVAATPASSSQINSVWTASTDNVGVVGYRIYRNGIQIGTSTTTSYTDTGLQPSTTYTYTVTAYDAAGNQSAQSTQVSARTPSFIAAPANLSVVVQ